MQRISRDRALTYRLDASLAPVLTVAAGETFAVETEDASSGLLTSGDLAPTAENLPYVTFTPARANPVGGPMYVEGVKARSRISVEVRSIHLEPTGVTYNRPALSPLGDSKDWPEGTETWTVRVHHRDGQAIVSDRLQWPLSPMIGTLACAPEWEAHASSVGQGPWGGNLDVSDVRPGATVHLNAYHEGGLLFVGDVHGCQGDGEYYGVADESRSEVLLRAWPVEGPLLPAPRIETDTHVVALGIEKPLELAAHLAILNLMRWLAEEHGFSRKEAYLTVGLNPDFRLRVYQMTVIRGLSFVVGACLPRSYLGAT